MACTSFQPSTVDRAKHSLGCDKAVASNDVGSAAENDQVLNSVLTTYKQVLQLVQDKSCLAPSKKLDPKLQEMLSNDPCWVAATQGKPAPGGAPSIGNFFMIVFKYMTDHANSDNQIQVAQAMNMVCQNNILDSITSEAMANLNTTETSVAQEESQASKSLVKGLCIGIGLSLALAAAGGAVGGGAGGFLGASASATKAATIAVTVATAGIGFTTDATMGVYNKDVTEASGEMTEMQAFMAVNSAASGNVGNAVKEDQQIQQTELSDVQSTQSLEVTMVQAETSVFSLGNF